MRELRVMTFNVRVDTPKDGERRWANRKSLAAQAMREADADVIAVQEALPRMLDDICERLPGYERFGVDRSGKGNDEHCAVLFRSQRFRLEDGGTFWLSRRPNRPGSRSWFARHPRVCTWCELRDAAGNMRFRLYNTHLDHFSRLAKRRGMETLLSMIRSHRLREPLPFIVAGDFNAGPDHPVLQSALRYPLQADRSAWGLRTFHGYRGGTHGTPIDHVLASEEWSMRCEVLSAGGAAPFPSDHYPVLCRLTLNM